MKKKGYLLPTLARKITLPTFRLNAPVIIRAKVEHSVEMSAKLFSELELVTDNLFSSFMQKPTEKSLKVHSTKFSLLRRNLKTYFRTHYQNFRNCYQDFGSTNQIVVFNNHSCKQTTQSFLC